MRYTLFLLNMVTPNYNKLSRAWVGGFLPSSTTTASPPTTNTDHRTIQNAIQRALPLLFEDPTSVPFICRYRSDIISPLSTKQVHQLSATVQKYESLSNLRKKHILKGLRLAHILNQIIQPGWQFHASSTSTRTRTSS